VTNDSLVIEAAGINTKPELAIEPPRVVTETTPVDPEPTTALILVGESTLKDVAAVLPKLTAEASVKLEPRIVTEAPKEPLVGEKEEIVGAGIKVKPELVTVPPGVVTETSPVDPDPTIAVILIGESIVKDVAAVPPKLTPEASVKLAPEMVTEAPNEALVGEKEEIVGAGIKAKPELVIVPPDVVTETSPVDPEPTIAVILMGESIVKDVAAAPPKLTEIVLVKLVPVIVTDDPSPALVGSKVVIVGGAGTIIFLNTVKAFVAEPTIAISA